jgi:hypothetical protein
VAFNYCQGLFGHLDSPLQLTDWEQARQDNPKWRALLDANTPKVPLATQGAHAQAGYAWPQMRTRATRAGIIVDAARGGEWDVSLFDLRGARVEHRRGDVQVLGAGAASGVYLVRGRSSGPGTVTPAALVR